MNIKHFPLPANKAIDIIKSIADKAIHLPKYSTREWPHIVMRRQVARCLSGGIITGNPTINKHGHYEYTMHRNSAGQEIYVFIVLYKNKNNDWTVRVLGAEYE